MYYKENQKKEGILLDVKSGGGNRVEVSSDTWGNSHLKEVMAHFPGKNMFSFKKIDQFSATTTNGMGLNANKVQNHVC